jgi:hypothetical protein
MLYDFLKLNRPVLIERRRAKVEVTEYARRNRSESIASQASLSALVHELRDLHNASIVALTALRHGTVGATEAALDASMSRTGELLDRAISLADAGG